MKSRILLAAACAGVVVYACLAYHLDLDVYRIGGRNWLEGGNLYGALPSTAMGVRMPFTYPPLAAIILSPLSLIPMKVAGILVDLGIVAVLALALRPFYRRLGWRMSWVLPAALLLEPVRGNLAYGQVDVFLMAMVIADCLTDSPRWPRGSLAGLAAAMKLTPALFIVFFLLRRDYRAAATMGASFVVASGVGFLLAPADSARYWSATLFNVGRIGGPQNATNQSVFGVLTRAGLHPGTTPFICFWLVISALVIAAACVGMRHALAAGDVYLALVLNAFAILLVSPISWSHHWVWAVPALLCLAISARRLAVTGFVLFAVGPQCWLPQGANRELSWAPWQQILGDSYVLCAFAVIGWFAYRALAANVGLLGRLAPRPFPSPMPLAYPPDDVAAASSHSRSYPAYSPTGAHITASEPG
ncbi:MAG: glycosyltransferase 87 family protein [Trebonia sp.]|jgi:alpha-1,2-mannosyltransferase